MKDPVLRIVVTSLGGHAETLQRRIRQIAPRLQEVAVCAEPALLGEVTRFGDYDAVLVDWHAGEDALQQLADAFRACPMVPVLVVSNQPEARYAERILRMGAQDYLVKRETRGPQLLRAVHHAVERKRLDIQLKTTLGELGQANARLRSLALKDTLTGALNRRAFSAIARQTLARAARHGRRLALLYCDLDGFKQVNDKLGHAAGDAVLVAFCQRATAELRRGDCLARLGGDEFVILLETEGEASGGQEAAGRIQRACAAPLTLDGHAVNLRVSIGIAEFPAQGTVEALIRAADQDMYRAKARSRAAVASDAPVSALG